MFGVGIEYTNGDQIGAAFVQELEQPGDLRRHLRGRKGGRPLIGEPTEVGAGEVGECFAAREVRPRVQFVDDMFNVGSSLPGHGLRTIPSSDVWMVNEWPVRGAEGPSYYLHVT